MIKKKILKKSPAAPEMLLPKPGKYAAPVPVLPLGTKDGLPALKKGFKYPSGVSEARKIDAFDKILYVSKKKLTIDIKDLYPALMNRVKDYCNVYDLLRYESSTKDLSIRKKLEYCMRTLREMGYLSPANAENTVTLLKVIPPGLKLKSGK
jgi:hypothetical protein